MSRKYYHYTDEEGMHRIFEEGIIFVTPKKSVHAHFGSGVYLTAIPPRQGTKAVLQNNYDYATSRDRNPNTGTKADYYFEFLAEDLPGLQKAVADNRSVYIYPWDIYLDEVDYTWGKTRRSGCR